MNKEETMQGTREKRNAIKKILIPIIVITISIIFRFIAVQRDGLTIDEFYTYQDMTENIYNSEKYLFIEQVPPLFFVLVKLSTFLGGYSEASLRFISILSSALVSLLIYLFISRYSGNALWGAFASLLYLWSPLAEYYSHMARPYGLLSLFFLASTVFLINYIDKPNFKSLAAFTVFNCCMLYTHYYALFMMPVLYGGLVLFAAERKKAFLHALKSGFIVFFAWTPWLYPFVKHFTSVSKSYWIQKPHLADIYSMFSVHYGYSIIVVVLCLVPVLFLRKNRKPIFALLFIISVLVALSYIYSIASTPVFLAKRVGITVLSLVICALVLIIANSRVWFTVKALLGGLLLLNSVYAFMQYNDSYPHLDDWRSTMRFLSHAITHDENILYSESHPPPIVEYYGGELTNRIANDTISSTYWMLSRSLIFSMRGMNRIFENNALIEEYGIFKPLQSPLYHLAAGGKTLWLHMNPAFSPENGRLKTTLERGCYIIRGRMNGSDAFRLSIRASANIIYTYNGAVKTRYLEPRQICLPSKSNQIEITLSTPLRDIQWLSFHLVSSS